MDYELIWWLVVGGLCAVFMLGALFFRPLDNTIDITWGKERDWARREREGKL